MELTTNRAVEDAAIAWVIDLERGAGRPARDTRGRSAPADIESPPRTIEVKAFGRSARGEELWLEPRQVTEAETNPEFFLYVVENVRQGDAARFELRVLGRDDLRELLLRKREHRYFTLPWAVSSYDATPRGLR